VKKLLKRFFSDEPWTDADDRSLADLVGPGDGWWRHEWMTAWCWSSDGREGSFRIEPSTGAALGETFDGPVVPEATPNPRTIRFVTAVIHDGPSRWYESAGDVDDPRVARLFGDFADVANVLVGPDFVAVGLRRPDAWEHLLDPVLRVITAQFAPATAEPARSDAGEVAARGEPSGPRSPSSSVPANALDRAWRELGALRPHDEADLDRILAARSSPDAAYRQVAARVLIDADPATAEPAWERLVEDPSRSVRRATVDAMVDAERPALRALLERGHCSTPMRGHAGRHCAGWSVSGSSRAAASWRHSLLDPTSACGSRPPAALRVRG